MGFEKNTQDAYISVSGLSKTFEKNGESFKALDGVSFTVNRGEIVCIVGASGCGKSTLLRAISGLDPVHDGTVTVDGKEITKPAKERGVVFQEHRLFPWMTVEQNIGYVLSKKSRAEKKELIKQHIELVGLNGFEKSYPGQLSGGMAQRAGIARALANNPPLLLLDEPFGALDTFTKIAMQKELKRIQRQSETTMLMVTHDIEEAVYLSDKVIVLSSRPGKIKRIVNVDLPVPRNRNTYDYHLLCSTIKEADYDYIIPEKRLYFDKKFDNTLFYYHI
ncbi:MAG: ABC transporter ATP-binding protein [Oscillospiraceae bacterium]